MEVVLLRCPLSSEQKLRVVELVQLLEQVDEPLDELHVEQTGLLLSLGQLGPLKAEAAQLAHVRHRRRPLVGPLGPVLRQL